MYEVNATPPSRNNTGWTYADGYFPRKIRYQKDAESVAAYARKMGATKVTVKKVK